MKNTNLIGEMIGSVIREFTAVLLFRFFVKGLVFSCPLAFLVLSQGVNNGSVQSGSASGSRRLDKIR